VIVNKLVIVEGGYNVSCAYCELHLYSLGALLVYQSEFFYLGLGPIGRPCGASVILLQVSMLHLIG
jgi:hypothetical protein